VGVGSEIVERKSSVLGNGEAWREQPEKAAAKYGIGTESQEAT
jgi:hypothetical protein